MKPTDPEFEKMLGELFQAPETLETAEVQYQRVMRRFRRTMLWLGAILFVGYGLAVSTAVVIVVGWLKLLGVI